MLTAFWKPEKCLLRANLITTDFNTFNGLLPLLCNEGLELVLQTDGIGIQLVGCMLQFCNVILDLIDLVQVALQVFNYIKRVKLLWHVITVEMSKSLTFIIELHKAFAGSSCDLLEVVVFGGCHLVHLFQQLVLGSRGCQLGL